MKSIKYYITIFFCFIFHISAIAKTIHVHIDNIASTSGYYSFKLFIAPYDENSAYAVPVWLGPDFINRYLRGISGNDANYLLFGYYDYFSQETTWFPENCTIPLNKDENITVNIAENACHYELNT